MELKRNPLAALIFLGILLFALHFFVLEHLLDESDYFYPLWLVYFGQTLIVFFLVFAMLRVAKKDKSKVLITFLSASTIKMLLSIGFFIPLFLKNSGDNSVDLLNFFIPYFVFLTFEVVVAFRLLNTQ